MITHISIDPRITQAAHFPQLSEDLRSDTSSFSELLLHENVLEPLSQSYGPFELGYLGLIPEKMALN